MRISDWSSDVCSSDLVVQRPGADHAALAQHVVVDLVVAGQRAGVRGGGACAERGTSGLQRDHRLLLRDPLGDLGEGAAVLQVLHVHGRSEEHTSELQSLMRISYAVFCLKKKNTHINQ